MRKDDIERRPEDFAFDLAWSEEYLGVRVDQKYDGEKIGILITHSENEGKVLEAIEADRKEHPDSLYHFFEPRDFFDKREGKLIGGEE